MQNKIIAIDYPLLPICIRRHIEHYDVEHRLKFRIMNDE